MTLLPNYKKLADYVQVYIEQLERENEVLKMKHTLFTALDNAADKEIESLRQQLEEAKAEIGVLKSKS